ncbi:MAG: murein transglycosylase A [Vibrionaceae bacterium]
MKYYLFPTLVLSMSLVGCMRPKDHGQQYLDGKFTKVLNPVVKVVSDKPRDLSTFAPQFEQVKTVSPKLVDKNKELYENVLKWAREGGDVTQLAKFGIAVQQMGGGDGYGNVLFTGYFSPVIEMSRTPTPLFRYPVYKMPAQKGKLPTRAQIYAGALKGQNLEIGYSKSLIDNFLMEVQGSGFVQFVDSDKQEYFAYSGKNGHAYTSIGRVLIDKGEVKKEDMSMQAIVDWVKQHSEKEVLELLNHNASFVFFEPKAASPVMGAAGVPLLSRASVAADPTYLPMGSVLLAEVPQIDEKGKWQGKHVLTLLMALDKGGAVKGNHLDLYHGAGAEAGVHAGNHKHFGRVWRLGKLSLPELTLLQQTIR